MSILKKPIRAFRTILYKKKININIIDSNKLKKYHHIFISETNQLINKESLESIRIILKRALRKRRYLSSLIKTKKKGIINLNLIFKTPITKKGSKSRMGKGKGQIKEYMGYIHINDILFSISNVSIALAKKLLKKIKHKLGFSIKMISYNI